MPTKTFKKRTYESVSDLVADLVWPFRHRRGLRRAMGGDLVSPAFRERLMLAVTAVNDCRYCDYYHARAALTAGLSDQEVAALRDGVVDNAPAEQVPALLYAQHWAEGNGRPDPAARQTLYATYAPRRAQAIETVLRMIRTGNLMGNTADYILFRLSGGRLGTTTDLTAD